MPCQGSPSVRHPGTLSAHGAAGAVPGERSAAAPLSLPSQPREPGAERGWTRSAGQDPAFLKAPFQGSAAADQRDSVRSSYAKSQATVTWWPL